MCDGSTPGVRRDTTTKGGEYMNDVDNTEVTTQVFDRVDTDYLTESAATVQIS